jgi:tetratricopeptide (TPR) repeat protein
MRNEKSFNPVFAALIVLLTAIPLVFSGCIIKTADGTEYGILDTSPDKPEAQPKDKPEDLTREGQTDATDDFAELPDSEQEKLALSEVAPEPEIEDVAPDEQAEDRFPTRVTTKPRGELPMIAKLYAVPATAEAVVFDPTVRHRSNLKASLSLTEQGRQALDTGKVDLAIAKFQKAISVDSNNGYAYFYFARARFMQKEWDQTVALADKSTIHMAKDAVFLSRANLLKGQALANQKRYIAALAACESAVDADSTNVQAKLLRNRLKQLF